MYRVRSRSAALSAGIGRPYAVSRPATSGDIARSGARTLMYAPYVGTFRKAGSDAVKTPRLATAQIQQTAELVRLVAGSQSHGNDDIVVVDEFPPEAIDRGGTAGPLKPQAWHAPEGSPV